MADISFDAAGGPATGLFGRAANLAAATLSLSLMAGLGFWGWELLMRDATGVPVVRALEGPMRVAPEDPGGILAENQGLAVNRIAGEAGTVTPPEQVMLAPGPVELAAEDLPVAALQPAAPAAAAPLEAAPEESLDVAPLGEAFDVAPMGEAGEVEPAATPLPDPARKVTITPGAVVVPAVLTVPDVGATDLAVAEALAGSAEGAAELIRAMAVPAASSGPMRPAPRPRLAGAPVKLAAAPVTVALEATALPAGSRLVQLGAFETEALAHEAWDALAASFGAYMAGKSRVVQEAETGGAPFWRLRAAGFDDLADARRFCSALVARQAECIPVVQR